MKGAYLPTLDCNPGCQKDLFRQGMPKTKFQNAVTCLAQVPQHTEFPTATLFRKKKRCNCHKWKRNINRNSNTAKECKTSPQGNIKHFWFGRAEKCWRVGETCADPASSGPLDKTTLDRNVLKQCVRFPAGYTIAFLLLRWSLIL